MKLLFFFLFFPLFCFCQDTTSYIEVRPDGKRLHHYVFDENQAYELGAQLKAAEDCKSTDSANQEVIQQGLEAKYACDSIVGSQKVEIKNLKADKDSLILFKNLQHNLLANKETETIFYKDRSRLRGWISGTSIVINIFLIILSVIR